MRTLISGKQEICAERAARGALCSLGAGVTGTVSGDGSLARLIVPLQLPGGG
jgi:hypothetical protein